MCCSASLMSRSSCRSSTAMTSTICRTPVGTPAWRREQSRGLFFEAMELEELRKAVRPGAHVVDVGANTGNHAIFFAGPMKAASGAAPFEPLPAAADALRAGVARNGLTNVDLSRLGVGVSDEEGRSAKAVFSGRGGLGATSLEPDPEGEISVATLDSMVSGRVDLLKSTSREWK